jgi:hypothetical protein
VKLRGGGEEGRGSCRGPRRLGASKNSVRAEVGGGRDWHTLAAKGLAEAGEGIGRLPPNKSENWKNRRVRRRLRECCEDVARMLRGWSLFLFSPRLLSVVSSERRETQSVVNGVGP